MRVTPVHRVGPGGERLAGPTPVGRVPRRLAVDDVRRDRQDRLRGHRVAVRRVLADLRHERLHEPRRDLVGAVVVVAVGREVAVDRVVDDDASVVAHGRDLRVSDRRQRVRGHRQPRDPARHGPQHVLVVQRHLEALVRVAVVGPVDAVERLDVRRRQPVERRVEPCQDVVVVEDAVAHRRGRGRDLGPRDLVPAAVDRVEQRLRDVHARAEELHLLADPHRGHAARDARVVTPVGADRVVRLVLHRRRVDRHLRAELLEALRQARSPEHRHVRLGRRAEVVERLEEAERVLGDERAPVVPHAADRLGHPRRVAREQGVVLGGAQEAHDPQLDDEVVDELLRLLLGEDAGIEVALQVDVEERRRPAQRHRGAVLLLHRGEVGEVQPLDRLVRVRRGAAHVTPVGRRHLDELAERPELLGVLLTVAQHRLGPGLHVHRDAVDLLRGDEGVDAVQRDAAVVADDASATVRVGQAGHDVRGPRCPHRRRVDVEHGLVVGLAVLREDLPQHRVDGIAVRLERALDHAPATVRHDRALERGVRLEPDDELVLAVDVAGCVRRDRRGRRRVDVVDALLPLLREHRGEPAPERGGALRRAGQERAVAVVRGVVALDEVADVHAVPPGPVDEALPRRLVRGVRAPLLRQVLRDRGGVRSHDVRRFRRPERCLVARSLNSA